VKYLNIDVDCIKIREHIGLCSEAGINCEPKYSEDVISDLKSSINNDIPVIINVDNYYNPLAGTYHIGHSIHCMLAYGYNDNTLKFNVINSQTARGFYAAEISYQDIYNSYNGLLECQDINIVSPTYIEINTDNNVCDEKIYFDRYRKKILYNETTN